MLPSGPHFDDPDLHQAMLSALFLGFPDLHGKFLIITNPDLTARDSARVEYDPATRRSRRQDGNPGVERFHEFLDLVVEPTAHRAPDRWRGPIWLPERRGTNRAAFGLITNWRISYDQEDSL